MRWWTVFYNMGHTVGNFVYSLDPFTVILGSAKLTTNCFCDRGSDAVACLLGKLDCHFVCLGIFDIEVHLPFFPKR